MKRLNLLILLTLPFFFTSCLKDRCTREVTYTKSTPIYKTLEEIRTDISFTGVRELEKPGKIYYYQDYLFINEIHEGVHIIDNSDPTSPQTLGFLTIPGNVDISIRGNVLYADNYIDLLAIDISDFTQPTLLKRVKDVFPHYGQDGSSILVAYDQEEVTETIDCDATPPRDQDRDDVFLETAVDLSADQANSSGIGGSLARFSLYDNYLYTIDHSDLHVFDINQLDNPVSLGNVPVGWEIETLFSHSDKLFIGSTTGMIIMDASTPSSPTYLSRYDHMYACDPVFVKEPYAYVTLRGGSFCRAFDNQLDLVDISNLEAPFVEKSFPMDNPHGLSIVDNTLFLCEGDHGLKTFDIADPLQLDQHQIGHLENVKSIDVIALPDNRKLLLIIGDDGFYQFSYDDPSNLEFLSRIAVKRS